MTEPPSDGETALADGETAGDPLDRSFQSHAEQVGRQALVFVAGSAFLVVGGYLFKVYVSRTLGAGGMGLYSLGMTLVTLGAVIGGLGLPTAAARYVAIYDGSRATAAMERFARRGWRRLFIASIVLACALIAGRRVIAETVFGEPELARWLPIFALILILHTCRVFFGQFLRGLRQVSRRTFINQFVAFPVKVMTTLALFAAGWGLSGYVAAEAVSSALALTWLAVAVRRRIAQRKADQRRAVHSEGIGSDERPTDRLPTDRLPTDHQVRAYAGSMVGLGLLGFVAGQADVFLLGVFLDASTVGIYAVAVANAGVLPTVLRAVGSIFGPISADLHAQKQSELLARLFQTSTKWCLALTWPLVAVTVAFSTQLMGLFGAEFEAGATTLALLAVAQLVNVGVGPAGNLLVMSGHQRSEIFTVAVTAALALALNLILIPHLGLLGAAVSLAGSLTGSNLLRAWLVRRRLGILPYNRHAWRLVLPLVASTTATLGFRSVHQLADLPAILSALVIAYVTLVATAIWALDTDDRTLVLAVWKKIKAIGGRA